MTEMSKIAVIDVDDTLLCGNSLKMLLYGTLMNQMKRRRWRQMSLLCWAMMKRILHMSSHVELKQQICRSAIDVMTDADFDALTTAMLAKVRPSVRRIINRWIADGGDVVIASAGMRFCLQDMVRQMGLRYLVATDYDAATGGMGHETRSESKLQAVRTLAVAERLGDIGMVVTDHIDDLPLLSLPDIRRVLVAPRRSLCQTLDASSLSYEIIN
jgi:hypothetical protein